MNMPPPHQRRIPWVDMVRIASILMVISMHAGDEIVYDLWGKAPFRHGAIASWWLSGIVYKSLSSLCVPLLFMLSGYLLLSSNYNTFSFFKKRFTKVLIPLFAWSAIYMWWDGELMQAASLQQGVKFIIRGVLTDSAYFHLWFLYVLIGLYLVTPLLGRFIQNASDPEIAYIIGLWLVSILMFAIIRSVSGYEMVLFSQPYVSGYLGYFVAGYFLDKREYSTKTVALAAAFLVLAIVGKTLWAYYLTYRGGKFDTDLFDYLHWHVVLPSLAGFIVFKYVAQVITGRLSQNLEVHLQAVSNATFGIYLIHIIVLQTLHDGVFGFHLSTGSFHPLLAIPITTVTVFFFSFFIIYPLQKIPLFNKIVP